MIYWTGKGLLNAKQSIEYKVFACRVEEREEREEGGIVGWVHERV